MKIVADKEIPGVEKAFAHFGELLLLPGRKICQEDVRDADALVVRTVTRVDEALVNDTALRFIGSATSGTDHVDTDQLEKLGIRFCHAPGCNADAVVDYVLAALAMLAGQRGEHWRRKHVGIIGAGNVGSRLARLFLRLGMPVTIYDPLLEPTHKLADYFGTFEEVISCDIVSLHVPLIRTGPHPTFHMLDANTLGLLKNGAILINAARGEVIDNSALSEHLQAHPDLQVVLDTWENEPAIHSVLLGQVAIATPHIAGYSRKGKSNGTAAVLKVFCEYFDFPLLDLPLTDPYYMLMLGKMGSNFQKLNLAILQAYPIAGDQLDRHDPEVVRNFEFRRNNYAFRKEFGEFSFQGDKVATALAADLSALRFLCG
jgi:erythronate-4-phosphate dehydrogenase